MAKENKFLKDDLELGELTMTLCYLPAAGRLTVTIVKALNLKAMDINGKSGLFVFYSKRWMKYFVNFLQINLRPVRKSNIG